jgi:spore coat protein CotH
MSSFIPRRRVTAVGSVLACLLTCTAAGADAQTAADLFDRDTVQEIRLSINSRDLQDLREHFGDDTYYIADFEWRSMRVRNVAIRSRGGGSRNPSKPGLRVDFNRYTAGQRFLGMTALVLDNVWQDGSFVAESTAFAFFERMGQAAPRTSFCRLFINDVYQGLYAIVESVNADFVKRFSDKDVGYLFSYQYHDPYFGEYLGDDLAPYKRLFEAQTHERDADTMIYSPIRNLFRELNHAEDAVWRDRVEEYLDLPRFVTQAAIEVFLAENDGVLGASGMNNFYLYREAGSTRHRLFPWDKDSAFSNPQFDLLTRADENLLFRRAMAYADLRALYWEVLEACARSAAADGWLEAEITRAAALIDASVRDDTRKPFSSDEFDGAVALLLQFARTRSAYVLREIDKLRRTP